jgi:hypothetical protein
MEPKDTKYCAYCGKEIPIDSERCIHCGEWLNESSVTRNHTPYSYTSEDNLDKGNNTLENSDLENENLGYIPNKRVEDNYPRPPSNPNNPIRNNNEYIAEYSKILPMRRFFLLMLFTGNLYAFYWIYKTNCYLRDDLGKDVSPGFRTFLLIIPLLNIISFYQTIEDMNDFIKSKSIETYSSGLSTLVWIFLRSITGIWVYVNVQESINDFWRIKEPKLPIRREFNGTEIVVMILGVIFWIIFIILYFAFLVYMGAMT